MSKCRYKKFSSLSIQQIRGRISNKKALRAVIVLGLFKLWDTMGEIQMDGWREYTCPPWCFRMLLASSCEPQQLERLGGPSVTCPCYIWSVVGKNLPFLQNAGLPSWNKQLSQLWRFPSILIPLGRFSNFWKVFKETVCLASLQIFSSFSASQRSQWDL